MDMIESMMDPLETRPFQPSPADVCVVMAMLEAKRTPREVAIIITEMAEYWPCSRSARDYTKRLEAQGIVRPTLAVNANNGGNICLIRTPPIGLRYPPCADFQIADRGSNISKIKEEATREHFEQYLKESMPLLPHPVRKIVFTIESGDQGWTHQPHNTYQSSWTWFEVGLERYDISQECLDKVGNPAEVCVHHRDKPATFFFPFCKLKPVQPHVEKNAQGENQLHYEITPNSKYTIQRNLVAHNKPILYTITWSCDDRIDPLSPAADELDQKGQGRASKTGEFVRSLKTGDVVTLWAKARFPGWTNRIYRASVEVFWAVV